jgi:hypothetical protein
MAGRLPNTSGVFHGCRVYARFSRPVSKKFRPGREKFYYVELPIFEMSGILRLFEICNFFMKKILKIIIFLQNFPISDTKTLILNYLCCYI